MKDQKTCRAADLQGSSMDRRGSSNENWTATLVAWRRGRETLLLSYCDGASCRRWAGSGPKDRKWRMQFPNSVSKMWLQSSSMQWNSRNALGSGACAAVVVGAKHKLHDSSQRRVGIHLGASSQCPGKLISVHGCAAGVRKSIDPCKSHNHPEI
jgi:hypothetical protein